MELSRPFECRFPGCTKSYTNSSHLKRHSQVHELTKETYSCKFCSASISTKTNLKRHYNRVHNPNRQLFCQECSKLFRKKNLYEEHMAIHKNSSLYKCETCEKMFITEARLKQHEQYHKPKNYACPYEGCSQIFDTYLLMQEHRRTHEEFKCAHCQKVLLSRPNLLTHLKIHAENRPSIACPYENCNRIYYFKKNLEQHIRSKHLEKKFECDFCKRKLCNKQKVKEHIFNIHLSEKKPIKKKPQSTRKDKGLARHSILSKLTGIQLSVTAEVLLMQRNPAALERDKLTEENSFSEDDRASDVSAKGA